MPAPKAQDDSDPQRHKHAVYRSETAGLLLIWLMLLILTLIRYCHNLPWSLG